MPWNVVWLVLASWVISYANEWEGHPTIGEPPTPPSFDSALELSCHLGVSFSLQIEDQGLVKVDLSFWTHLILVYVMPLGYVILSKVVPSPLPSCSMLFS